MINLSIIKSGLKYFAPALFFILMLTPLKGNDLSEGPVIITFVNYTTIDTEIFQVTPDERDIFKSRLSPGASYDLKINPGFKWRVKSAENRANLMEGIASSSETYIEIVLKSNQSGSPVEIVFYNYAKQPVSFYWVDANGKAVEQGVIPDGQQATQPASSSSVWSFKTLDGQSLGKYVASQHPNQSFTIKGNSSGVPSRPKISSGESSTNDYSGRGQSGNNDNTPHQPTSNANMLEVSHLGVGYDAVRVDPENLAENSVNNNSAAPPQVFEFIPNPNKFFTITKSRDVGEVEKIVPKGVTARQGEKTFSWSSEVRWSRTASQFQKSFAHAYSGSIGVPGVASVSLSASFKDVQETTQEDESLYVYKDGSFKGHILQLDSKSKTLTDAFKNAVSQLGNSPKQYDAFIQKWGTHYSSENTMGAKCYYRFTLTKSSYSNSNKSEMAFEQDVEASVAKIGGSIGAGQEDMEASKAEEEMSASDKKFESFGASGESDDFGKWSKDAMHNTTVIDVRLKSYLELFNNYYFPKDTKINTKKRLLNEAIQRYFKKHAFKETVNVKDFYKTEPRSFKVTVKQLVVKKAGKDEERHYGGILKIGVYDNAGIDKKSLLFMNLNGGSWLDWGQWKGHYITKKEGEPQNYNNSFSITLKPKDFANSFVTITGTMTETWHWGTDSGTKSMGSKTQFDTGTSQNRIELKNLEKGQNLRKNVTYSGTEGDRVEIYFEVERTN